MLNTKFMKVVVAIVPKLLDIVKFFLNLILPYH